MLFRLWIGALLAGTAIATTPAAAQSLPAVNLGATSFMDGAPPAGPGLYFSEYVQNYSAGRINDNSGHRLPFPSPRLETWASLSQFIYMSDKTVLGGVAHPAIDVILPAASIDLSYSGAGPFPRASHGGFGDILIGPALQFNPIEDSEGHPIFVHRLEAQFIIPTGQYSNRYDINASS